MFPVFSLVMDKDVREAELLKYVELYKELEKVGFRFFLACAGNSEPVAYHFVVFFELHWLS